MAIQALSLRTWLSVTLTVTAPSLAAAGESNAIGGTVRDASTQRPLGGVDVEITQASKLGDRTREDDGVYTLNVPASLDTIDIIFKKTGYLNAFDPDVKNDKSQQKRPVTDMTARDAIKNLPKERMEAILKNTHEALKRAGANPKTAARIREAAKENIDAIKADARLDAELRPLLKEAEGALRKLSD